MKTFLTPYLIVSVIALFLVSACGDSEGDGGMNSGGFDVQFVLPAGIELSDSLVTFTVIDGKAPLMTDYFVFEPVGQADNVSYSYPCPITETSSISFTVEIPYSLSSGQYGAYISRGSEMKAYGVIYLAIVRLGETLPNWVEGQLDIHFINTGRGECSYQIFPDGTTLLVDASGYTGTPDYGSIPYKPNGSATAGQTIVNYINHFSPDLSTGHLDYFLLTHHHSDHMGTYSSSLADHSSGLFKLTSLCEIGSKLVMDKIFDRDYPNFSYPTPETSSMMGNYMAFLGWTASENGSEIEKWDVGSRTQVFPVHSSSWDYVVRNYAGSGCYWTGGADGETFTLMPDDITSLPSSDVPGENVFSCAYIASYGKFDFFLGGDLEPLGSGYFDGEAPLVDIVHKVEVMMANHHGHSGSQSTNLINKLAPDVWVVGVWQNTRHPDPGPISRTIAANPNVDVFCTYQSQDNLDLLGEENASHILGTGHIVVRVAAGGDSYMVYTLDDDDEEYRVKSIHGPYTCSDIM